MADRGRIHDLAGEGHAQPISSQRLIELYDRVAEAPDAVERLRKFVLDLAVRGKLVEQHPGDEPASELLIEISAQREQLVNAGKMRKSKASHPIDQTPFTAPPNWIWARLGQLGATQTGTTPTKARPEFYGSEIPFIRPGDLYPDRVDYTGKGLSRDGLAASGRSAPANSLLMVCIGTIGKCQIVDRQVSFNQQINALSTFPNLVPRYVLYAMQSGFWQRLAWDASARTTIAILNKGKWENLPIPLPPQAEQHRIVAKVNELMVLLDRLETTRTQRETTRDRLTTASLIRLSAADNTKKNFPTHARFALENLRQLTSRPGQIKVLRHTVIDLAVWGKLTDEDAADEPAVRLLERMAAERAESVTARNRGKATSTKSLETVDLPFDTPSHWCPVRLSQILHEIQTGPFGSSLHKSDYALGGIPVINPASIQNGQIVPIDKMAVGGTTLERLASFKLKRGDICIFR